MDSIISIFSAVFSFLSTNKIFNIPILIWFVGFATFALVISFLRGSKNK